MKNKLNFHLMSFLVVGFVLPSLGCQSGKLTFPKIPAPKLAFWKKDTDRIESQPDSQLTAPSQQLSPDSPQGNQNRLAQRSNNELPGSNYPPREPYKMPEIYEDPAMKNEFANKPLDGGGGQKSMVSNPYASNNNVGGSRTQVNNQHVDNSFPNQNAGNGNSSFNTQNSNVGAPSQSPGAAQVVANPYVNNNMPNNNVPNNNVPNNNKQFSNGNSNMNYPDTGFGGYQNQPTTQQPPTQQPPTTNQFPGELPNNNSQQNVPTEFKLSQPQQNQSGQNTLPQFANEQTNSMPASPPRTASLPPELMNSSGYQPGSTKLQPRFDSQKTSFDASPMPTQPAQEFQPEISPAGGGSFVPQ